MKVILRSIPDLIGLTAMAWQYETCVKIAQLLKETRPQVKIAIGGYHATLMHEEIAAEEEPGGLITSSGVKARRAVAG